MRDAASNSGAAAESSSCQGPRAPVHEECSLFVARWQKMQNSSEKLNIVLLKFIYQNGKRTAVISQLDIRRDEQVPFRPASPVIDINSSCSVVRSTVHTLGIDANFCTNWIADRLAALEVSESLQDAILPVPEKGSSDVGRLRLPPYGRFVSMFSDNDAQLLCRKVCQ